MQNYVSRNAEYECEFLIIAALKNFTYLRQRAERKKKKLTATTHV